METINFSVGWVSMSLGVLTGAIQGMFFHREDWMGGYASWPRRMTRLGHISFFGTAMINLGYALSVMTLSIPHAHFFVSWSLIVGAVAMPLVCYLSAYRKPFRHLFFIPVLSLVSGITVFTIGVLVR